jgi:hypothetical protein
MAKTSDPAYVVVVTSFHTATTGSDLSYLAGDVVTVNDPVYKKMSKDAPELFTPWALDHQRDETPGPAKRRPTRAKAKPRKATAAEEAGSKASVEAEAADQAEREAAAQDAAVVQPAALTTSSFGPFNDNLVPLVPKEPSW